MTPYYTDENTTLYLGDCQMVLPTLRVAGSFVVITDPPYRTNASGIPQRGKGVGKRQEESRSVGQPWGYSLEWIEACESHTPLHWVVFCNYAMLGGICSRLDPSCVFTWRKSNAPVMARPVPRLDCEFIIWSRSPKASCGRMGEFNSQVIDVPMPQAGCFATERILESQSGKAIHPCQKPIAVVGPFVERITDGDFILDPFAGTGTTLVAAKLAGRRAIGIEIDERYCEIAADRLRQGVLFGAA